MRIVVWFGALLAIVGTGFLADGQEKSREIKLSLDGHEGGVTTIAFDAKGAFIATGAGNGIVRLWEVKTGKLITKVDDLSGISITGLGLSPDGKVIAASGKGKVGSWSDNELRNLIKAEAGFAKGELKSYKWSPFYGTDSEGFYSDLALTGDGKSIYFTRRRSGNYPGAVIRYDRNKDLTEDRPSPKYLDPRSIASLSDPDSAVAAVYGTLSDKTNAEKADAAVILYGLGDPKIITRGVPPVNKEAPNRITFSTDGKWLATCSGTLAVWPVPGSHIIGGEPVLISGVYAASIGPDNLLATVPPPSDYQTASITLWKLSVANKEHGFFGMHWTKRVVEARTLATYPTPLLDVSCLAFSPISGTLAVGGSRDGVVQLWKLVGK